MFEVKTLMLGLYGDIKTGKTTIGLTFPKPIFFADFDLGFERAIWRFPNLEVNDLDARGLDVTSESLNKGDIIVKRYPPPVKWPGGSLDGFELSWNQICEDFKTVFTHNRIATIQTDTGTGMWNVDHQAHLERVQKHTPNKHRQNLQPIEYARPNTEMKSLISAARAFGKNLISVHHTGGIYEERFAKDGNTTISIRVGDTWEGFSKLGTLVDIIARAYSKEETIPNPDPRKSPTKKKVSYIIIEHCGLTLDAEGFKIVDPNFDKILNVVNMYRAASGVTK